MLKHPTKDKVYAAGYADYIAQSKNKGQSWNLIYRTWDSWGGGLFTLYIDENTGNIWAGGANALLRANLVVSYDDGKTWQQMDPTGAQAFVNDMVVHSQNPDSILVSIPSGIFKTTTGGGHYEGWSVSYDKPSTLIYTMESSANLPFLFYASGVNTDSTLFFALTDDFGENWTNIPINTSEEGLYVNDMISVMHEGGEVIFFATNKGVYSNPFQYYFTSFR